MVDCGALNNPTNGAISLRTGSGTTYGQTATFSCNVGYFLTGVSTRRCTATGQWSGSPPSCDREYTLLLLPGVHDVLLLLLLLLQQKKRFCLLRQTNWPGNESHRRNSLLGILKKMVV